MRESAVEAHLRRAAARRGLLCLKFTSPGHRGVPDRLVLGHTDTGHPVVLFIELKAPGRTTRPSQTAMIEKMRAAGAHVRLADRPEQVDRLLDEYFCGDGATADPAAAPLTGDLPMLITGL